MIDYKGFSMDGLSYLFQVLPPFAQLLRTPKPRQQPVYSYSHLNKLLTKSAQQHIYFIFLCRQNASDSPMAFFLGNGLSLIKCPLLL